MARVFYFHQTYKFTDSDIILNSNSDNSSSKTHLMCI